MSASNALDAKSESAASAVDGLGACAFGAETASVNPEQGKQPASGLFQSDKDEVENESANRAFTPSAAVAGATVNAFRLSRTTLVVSLLALVLAMSFSVSLGSSGVDFFDVVRDLLGRLPFVSIESNLTEAEQAIVWQWRLPRTVLGALVGSALSLSGASYQGVFRNPLADPYLLGVAAGAGLGATLAIVFDLQFGWGPVHVLPAAAFLGAMIAVTVSTVLGFGAGRSSAALLLAGVAAASFFTALQTFVMQRNSDVLLEVYSWILGRLGTFGWGEVGLLAPYVVICGGVILAFRRQLDVMRLGDDDAKALGVPVRRVRIVLLIASSLLAAAAVSVSGLISFVGIIVPHFVRLVVGSSYRVLLPLSAILGAVFVVLADAGARNLVDGAELPIGVVTAFFGAPFFAYVLWRNRGLIR